MPAKRQPVRKPRKKGGCYFRGDRPVCLGGPFELESDRKKVVRTLKKIGTTNPKHN